MSYLKFDKTLLINLERSLTKEMIRTNRAGAYNSTTLIDCNTRKYHGQLVLPLPELSDDNYVLLSSLDETVIQHGAEFNLGIHKYEGNNYSPNGHKYIRQFECDAVSRTIFRVGSVVLSKERVLVSYEPRVLIKYTLLEAHSPTTIRFKPFLAFRSVNELTQANDQANRDFAVAENGIGIQMYPAFPQLYMQLSKKNIYHHTPDWYKNIEYYKEKERGFDYKEDLYVPGYFEMPIKKGDEIIFSAGISEVSPRALRGMWNMEISKRINRTNMFECLKNSAAQFYKRQGSKCYLLAGYPWFKAQARDQFFSLAACTLLIDREEYWDVIMDNTSINEIEQFLQGKTTDIKLIGLSEPDALLWFIRAIQLYSIYKSPKLAAEKYGHLVLAIISFIRKQKHPRMHLHNNGLLHVDGTEHPATWMGAVENGHPITPRTGYVVEINALWYNALKFCAEMMHQLHNDHPAEVLNYQAEITKESFVKHFWNGLYLNDYVVGMYQNKEVRPNMIWAASFPYSPLDLKMQKAVVDICTKELLTPKGLRTLSPKSGAYRPNYVGGQLDRDRNYHNGPVWPCTIAAYAQSYLRVYKMSGKSFIERLLVGYEAEMSELGIGTLNELYDGNPPFKGHGGVSFAASVAAVIHIITSIKELDDE